MLTPSRVPRRSKRPPGRGDVTARPPAGTIVMIGWRTEPGVGRGGKYDGRHHSRSDRGRRPGPGPPARDDVQRDARTRPPERANVRGPRASVAASVPVERRDL